MMSELKAKIKDSGVEDKFYQIYDLQISNPRLVMPPKPIPGFDEVQEVIRADNQTATDLLRKRVLDLLLDPDPVHGIYAMYGAHVRD